MISSWRRRRSSGKKKTETSLRLEVVIPSHFRCPISLDLMKDPVTLPTGITYDRRSIETWLDSGNATCPSTNQALLGIPEPIPNHSLRKLIQDWCVQQKSFGVDRIPTPRVPTTATSAAATLSRLVAAAARSDATGCMRLVAKARSEMRESERNRRCFINNGAADSLTLAFEAFSSSYVDDEVLEKILSTLTLVFPNNSDEGVIKDRLSSKSSLACMVRFLEAQDLSRRRNAILVLKHIVSDEDRSLRFSEINGGLEALVKMVREPICPASTKAALMMIYHMVRSPSTKQNMIRERFVEMDVVLLALETVVEAEKSICEKALGVLEEIVGCDKGRDEAYRHALTVPVLVKKILRVSDLATEFSISILWKLMCGTKNDGDCNVKTVIEALEVGGFQKLLLVLQVGCGERVKEKTSELLKLLNLHRDRFVLDCIDSSDFKDLKRPF